MFITEQFVVRSRTPTTFTLVEPLIYQGRWESFTVPAGFTTDFASVPQILTWMIPRYGVYTRAAILHDYLCAESRAGRFKRADADGIFRRALDELGVSFPVRWMMWTAVRYESKMSGATSKDWRNFLLLAFLVVPFLLIPTAIVWFWTMLFRFINYLGA